MDLPLLHLRTPRQAERAFAEDVADGLLVEANMAADYAARFLRCIKNAGLPLDKREALRDLILDGLGDVQGIINAQLDNQGVEFDRHQIDLSDVEKA